MRKDLVVSAVLLAGLGALYWSLGLMEDPRAIIFPRILIIIMGVLALGLIAQSILEGQRVEKPVLQSDRVNEKKQAGPGKKYPVWTVFGCFAVIVIYFAVMERLGFYISAFLFFVTITFILGRRDLSLKKGGIRVLAAFIFTAVLYVLFNKLLVVQTPKGLLF